MKLIAQIAGLCIIILLSSAIAYHMWSDCLEENSLFTCARMLNK
jgi:hypothetical protein